MQKRQRPKDADVSQLLTEIYAIALELPDSHTEYRRLSDSARKRLRLNLETSLRKLDRIALHLDPIALPEFVFDPTAPKVVGRLVADTLLLQKRVGLIDVSETKFYGAGVYALYYRGKFDCYRPIAGKDHPIYVGKADPREPHAATPREQGDGLSRRFRDHARSIRGTTNLNVDEFDCRYLVVRSAWVETAEDHLIAHFKPVWNKQMKICYGFGKHGDAPITRSNKRSPWDTLHPGRAWATRAGNIPGAKSVEEIKAVIREHYRSNPPFD